MTAVTVTKRVEWHMPNTEILQLTITDGYTYRSSKLKVVEAVFALGGTDIDGALNGVISDGNLVTFNYASASAALTSVMLIGKQ